MDYSIVEFDGWGSFMGWLSEPDSTGERMGHLRGPHMYTMAFPTRESTLEDAIRKDGIPHHRDPSRLVPYPIPLGAFHPRIWRGEPLRFVPINAELNSMLDDSGARTSGPRPAKDIPIDERALTSTATSLAILLSDLSSLFLSIEPHPGNQDAYGHRIRHLLCTACMEVESGLSSVLSANGFTGRNPTTREYIGLKDPMKLEGWEIALVGYPDYPPLAPFRGWAAPKTSESLGWYDAYNKTKHQREQNLPLATLGQAISAVAAAMIVAAAQFGPEHWKAGVLQAGPHSQTLMDFAVEPSWTFAERYWEPEAGPWQSLNLKL